MFRRKAFVSLLAFLSLYVWWQVLEDYISEKFKSRNEVQRGEFSKLDRVGQLNIEDRSRLTTVSPYSFRQSLRQDTLNQKALLKETDMDFSNFPAISSKKNITMKKKSSFIKDTLPIVNPHDFNYKIHPGNLCDEELFLFIYVHTSPDHYVRRDFIRKNWANQKFFKDFKLKLLFVLGSTPDAGIQEAITMESQVHRDILQEDFHDSYRNLTYKAIAALKYIAHNCQRVPYVLKTDDDMFVNTFAVVEELRNLPKEAQRRLILCCAFYNRHAVQNKAGKWFVSEDEYKGYKYPVYCSGSAYIISSDIAEDLYNISLYSKFFWIDDVYITGILAELTGIRHRQLSSAYEFDFDKFHKTHIGSNGWEFKKYFSHRYKMQRAITLWNRIIKHVENARKSNQKIIQIVDRPVVKLDKNK